MPRNRSSIALVPLFAGLLGCASLPPPPPPRTFDDAKDAGTAHVAVLSVARWDDYVKDLQPSFTFTEDDALKRVSESTLELQDELVSSIATAVKLAPPTSSVTSTKTTGSPKTSTETTGPGDVTKVPDVPANAPALPTATALPSTAPSIEPTLKYALATSLYQEVKLLSRYVHDAVGANGETYDPYVVRMQITLLPAARREPYDAYSTVTFFAEEPAPAYETTPVIVPLLVTDNVESAFHSSATDQIRQAALSLLFMVHGFGGTGQFSKFENELKNILGNDYNSLLTVSRLSDNTYRVRLGAMRQVDTPYEMIPRSHNISFLLLMPRVNRENRYDSGGQLIHLVARTSFVHAETGQPLTRSVPGVDFETLRRTIKYYGKYKGLDVSKLKEDETLFRLIDAIERNDSEEFYYLLDEACPDFPSLLLKQTLWLDLASDMANSRYAATRFELPTVPVPDAFRPQTALILDGGQQSVQVSLHDGKHLSADGLSAVLHLYRCPKADPAPQPGAPAGQKAKTGGPASGTPQDGQPADQQPCELTGLPDPPVAGDKLGATEIALVASKIEILPGETDATFTFPPFSKLPQVASTKWIEVTSRNGFGVTAPESRFYRALDMPKPPAPPDTQDFDVSVPAAVVLASEGKGTLTIVVTNRGTTPVHFTVDEADVSGLTAEDGVQLDPVNRTILNGTVHLSLTNLEQQRVIQVRTWKEKAPAKPGDAPSKIFESIKPVDVRPADTRRARATR